MNPNERYVSLVKELISGVDAGDFDNIEAIPATSGRFIISASDIISVLLKIPVCLPIGVDTAVGTRKRSGKYGRSLREKKQMK